MEELAVPGTFGPYELIRKLGEGAYGRVFAARPRGEHVGHAAEVVIKVFALPAGAPDVDWHTRRFVAEVGILRGLSHPNIVGFRHSGVVDGRPYIEMELVRGPTLGRVLDDRGPLPPEAVVQLALQLTAGLDSAHDPGQGDPVVHRDLKPDNILLSRQGHVKIADFGLAKLTLSGAASMSLVVGTASYAAPEQLVQDGLVDVRADLFSLGVVLAEAALGARVFPEDAIDAMYTIKNRLEDHLGEVRVVPRVEAAVPGLGAVVARLLRARPDERYPSALAVEQAVRRATDPAWASAVRALRPIVRAWESRAAVSPAPPGGALPAAPTVVVSPAPRSASPPGEPTSVVPADPRSLPAASTAVVPGPPRSLPAASTAVVPAAPGALPAAPTAVVSPRSPSPEAQPPGPAEGQAGARRRERGPGSTPARRGPAKARRSGGAQKLRDARAGRRGWVGLGVLVGCAALVLGVALRRPEPSPPVVAAPSVVSAPRPPDLTLPSAERAAGGPREVRPPAGGPPAPPVPEPPPSPVPDDEPSASTALDLAPPPSEPASSLTTPPTEADELRRPPSPVRAGASDEVPRPTAAGGPPPEAESGAPLSVTLERTPDGGGTLAFALADPRIPASAAVSAYYNPPKVRGFKEVALGRGPDGTYRGAVALSERMIGTTYVQVVAKYEDSAGKARVLKFGDRRREPYRFVR